MLKVREDVIGVSEFFQWFVDDFLKDSSKKGQTANGFVNRSIGRRFTRFLGTNHINVSVA